MRVIETKENRTREFKKLFAEQIPEVQYLFISDFLERLVVGMVTVEMCSYCDMFLGPVVKDLRSQNAYGYEKQQELDQSVIELRTEARSHSVVNLSNRDDIAFSNTTRLFYAVAKALEQGPLHFWENGGMVGHYYVSATTEAVYWDQDWCFARLNYLIDASKLTSRLFLVYESPEQLTGLEHVNVLG